MRRLAGALLTIAVVATACGNGSSASGVRSDKDVLSVIQAAAATTAKQTSMRVSGTMHMGSGNGAISATLAGTMQTKPILGQITMSGLSIAGQSLGDVTMLLMPDAFYMKMPILAAKTGKPWAEMKFSEMRSASGLDMSQLMSQAQQMQPAQYIAQLTASGDVHAVGNESVDGVQTTHYAGTVSTADALSHYTPDVRAQMRPLLDQSGVTGYDLDVWLDSHGLVRRIRTTTQGGQLAFSFAMDVLAYGVPVHVTRPPASQVADLGSLTGAGSFS